MHDQTLAQRISSALDASPQHIHPLSGGMIGEVYRAEMADGRQIVAKVGKPDTASLNIEGYMLQYLAANSRLPVPQVLYSDDTLLLMTFIEGESRVGNPEQEHAADLLADLHDVTQAQFGLERDTLIGPIHQPNPLSDSWIDFFRRQRLLYMAHLAHRDGPLPDRNAGSHRKTRRSARKIVIRAGASLAHSWRHLDHQHPHPPWPRHRVHRPGHLLRPCRNRIGLYHPFRNFWPHFWDIVLPAL